MVAVGAHQVVVLDEGRRRQDEVRPPRRVGQEGVDDDDEVARLEGAGDGGRVGEHRDGVSGRDPDGADGGLLRLEDLAAEERLGERPRRRLPEEGGVEGAAPLEVEAGSAAGDPEVPRESRERVDRPDDRGPVRPPAHPPADLDVAGAVGEDGGEELDGVPGDVRLARPAAGPLRESEGPERLEPLAGRRGAGGDAAGLEEERGDGEGEGEVPAGARREERVRQGSGLVPHGVDEDDPRAAGLRLLQEREEVDVRDEGVLPPQDDPPRAREVEEVVRLLVAEVGFLGGVAGAGADVAPLHGDRPEELEEEVDDALDHPERAAGAVVEDRRGPRLGADREEALCREGDRLLPGDGTEAAALPEERRREPIGGGVANGELRRPRAEEAPRDRVGGVAGEPDEAAVLDGGEEAAGVGAVPVADGSDGLGWHGLDGKGRGTADGTRPCVGRPGSRRASRGG